MVATRVNGSTRTVPVGLLASGVLVAVALVAAAVVIPQVTQWRVRSDLAPLAAVWSPRLGPGTAPTLLLAVAAVVWAQQIARRARWGTLLLVSWAGAVAWMLALATVDGSDGLRTSGYLRTARSIADIGAAIGHFVEHIPADDPSHWPVHVSAHPPGALLLFVGLVRAGLGDPVATGAVVVVLAATTPMAVLLTMRLLGAESPARTVAPFLVFGPAAVWAAVSADAVYAAFAGWAACCLAAAFTTGRKLPAAGWGLVAGVLLGACVMLSYGLSLLAVLVVAIAVCARTLRPLGWVAAGALLVVGGFAAAGFVWWQGLGPLRDRYFDGVGSRRPDSYWSWANLAVLGLSAGPIVGASVAALASAAGRTLARARPRDGAERVPWVLGVAGVVMVLLADASGMSKGEVERIWLPFLPWLLMGCAWIPDRWQRPALALQVAVAVVVQHLLLTNW